MNERVHIVYLNSAAFSETYTDNRVEDFTVRLARPLQLNPIGDWYCCLKQSSFGFSFPGPLYVCCNLCVESTAGSRQLPVLRVVHKRQEVVYSDCLFVPLKVRDITEFRIYLLKTKDYTPPGYSRENSPVPTHMTLEFRRGHSHDQAPL